MLMLIGASLQPITVFLLQGSLQQKLPQSPNENRGVIAWVQLLRHPRAKFSTLPSLTYDHVHFLYV